MDYNEIVKNVNVYGFDESVRGAKFPMAVDVDTLNTELTEGIKALGLSPRGDGHDQYETGIIVQFDLTFSNKAWTELQRYHFVDFVSSQSTMHRITRFDLDKAYIDYVDKRMIEIMKEKVSVYNEGQANIKGLAGNISPEHLDVFIEEQKKKYLEILYSNPCGMKLTARLTTNYRQLKTIYAQRRNHRLPEWQAFCDWIETLPHSELITGKIVKSENENGASF